MKTQDDHPQGIILTYVDDVLILSSQENVKEWVDLIRSTWETSSPEWVNPDEPTRFLGMELKRSAEGIWTAGQKNYTLDVLRKNLKKTPWLKKKTPISKDGAESEGEDLKKEEEDEGPGKLYTWPRKCGGIWLEPSTQSSNSKDPWKLMTWKSTPMPPMEMMPMDV